MDKLDAKQQAEVGKMSTERLRMRLAKAGFDEEQVATLSRNDLMSLYAEYYLHHLLELRVDWQQKIVI